MTSGSGGDCGRGAPVSLGADPIEGESLPGFVMRLAARQRVADAARLAGMVGLRQPGSAVVSCDLGALARRAGTTVTALEAIAYRPAARPPAKRGFAGGHKAFLGGAVNREFIDISRRRACPRCLGESSRHRAVWNCALVTACPDHLVRLLDRCPAPLEPDALRLSGRPHRAGLDVLKRWPEPLHAFLGEQRLRAGQRRGRYGARKTLGAFYDWLILMEEGEVKAVLAEAGREFVQRDPELARRVHRSRLLTRANPEPGGGVLVLVDAARRMERSGETVKRMMAAEMLPAAASEGRGVPMTLDGEAVEALASRLRRAVPLVEAARMLGISRARARHLAEAGLIRPVQRATAGGWAQWAFDPAEIEDFLERLAAGASGSTPSTHTVSFNHMAEVLRRCRIPLARMVRRVLDGELAVLGVDHRATGLKRLRFDPADVWALCGGPADGSAMTIEAAAERLGLKWQVAAHLVRTGQLEAMDGGVSPASVERFAADYVTGAALACERWTSSRSLARKLADHGILPIVGPGIDGSRNGYNATIQFKTESVTVKDSGDYMVD